MRVHRSVRWPGPPRERVKGVSPPRGYPSLACHSGPPTPSNAAQQLAARSSQRSAAARSVAQSIALSDHGSAATVKEVDRPGLSHQRVLSADQQGRTPSRVIHFHNHRPTSTGRTPSPVLHHPPQQPPQDHSIENTDGEPGRGGQDVAAAPPPCGAPTAWVAVGAAVGPQQSPVQRRHARELRAPLGHGRGPPAGSGGVAAGGRV